MAYITRSELLNFKSRPRLLQKAYESRNAVRTAVKKPIVFLSHSHVDTELIESAAALLESEGADVYIDWLDNGLPDETNGDTASILKDKIITSSKFVVLCSANAYNSKWVPWELGYADGAKESSNIAVFHVVESVESYPGNEYLSLYQRIERAVSGNYAVFSPDKFEGYKLGTWLNG